MLAAVLLALAQPAMPPAAGQGAQELRIEASAAQLLALSRTALARGDIKLAIDVLETLLTDPDLRIRNEARFRLAMIARARKDWTAAGAYLRALLDEEPDAQRARLELARVQSEAGDLDNARRTLREAQAGALPADVARLVERFSNALRDRKPFGLSVQLALAPDTNINRATRSDTLGTVLGDFEIEDAAKSSSGIGVHVSSETYARVRVSDGVSLLARGGVTGDLYAHKDYNDITLLASAGPEFALLKGRANLLAGAQHRWYGGEPYARIYDLQLRWQRPLDRVSQLRTGLGVGRYNYRQSILQDATGYSAFATYERALTPRTGVNLTVSFARQDARDPAASSTNGQVSGTVWRDLGRATIFGSATYRRLEADERLALYRVRRREDFLQMSVGASLRSLSLGRWAPQLRVLYERNWSPIEIYDYARWRGEFGFVRAF